MLCRAQMIAGRDELLGAADPAALAAVAPARVFAACRAAVGQPVVIVPPGDSVGVGERAGRAGGRGVRRAARERSENAVDGDVDIVASGPAPWVPGTRVRIAIGIRDPGRDAVNYNMAFRPNPDLQ